MSESRGGKVQQIREYFHPQIKRLWDIAPILKDPDSRSQTFIANSHGYTSINKEQLIIVSNPEGATQKYLPLVCEQHGLTCSLDILLLRHGDERNALVSGDIDNRVKTLIDALRMPVNGEVRGDGKENPLYCLMSNDSLVSSVKVVADFLLAPPEQVIEFPKTTPTGEFKRNAGHVIAIIMVRTTGKMNLWI